ncbi:MAG: proton-conducting transporter membrane subunit [Anaerolineaceae bacterium]|nr:proton-conducting transporter membrane subunit [Anaerolineaceae bacterium]
MLNSVLAAFVLAFAAPLVARHVPRQAGAIAALLPAGIFVWLLNQAEMALGPGVMERWPWSPLPGVALTFRLDGLSLLMALIISGVGALILFYAGAYMQGQAQVGRLYALLLAFMASMLGLVLADNLIALFIFWELTSITSFLLIGWHFQEERSRAAALQALIVTGGGGLALLAGFVLIGLVGGTWEIAELATQAGALQDSALYLPILLLLWLGAASKSAQFPFHFWLPGAMVAPTPVSAYLHSATMVKAGVYLLARLSPALGGTSEWSMLFMVTGLVTLLLGGWLSLKQDDMKRMLAYSTVSSLGLLVTLLGLGTKLAAEAAALYLLAHALFKGALFMVAGAIDHATGTRDLRRLRGLAGALPTSALAAGLAGLSMAGLPLLAGFAAKEFIYEAALFSGGSVWLLTLLLLAGNVAFVVVAQQMTLRIFAGTSLSFESFHAPAIPLWLAALVPGALGLALGLLPDVTATLAGSAARAIYGAPVTIHLFVLPGSVTPMLLLSALTIAAGATLYRRRMQLEPWLHWLDQGARLGPERAFRRLVEGLPRFAERVTALQQNGRLRSYVLWIVGAWLLLLALTWALRSAPGVPADLLARLADLRFHEFILVLVILAGLASVMLANTLMTLIVSLGVVGIGTAIVFILFGAPDLAMTQFSIETLGVILFVLVLYRLPGVVRLSPRRTVLRDSILTGLAGAVVTLMILVITDLPLVSPLKTWFAGVSEPLGHGHNVVNVILVDFRGFDTMGEITVLGIAAIGIFALLKLRPGRSAGRNATDGKGGP